MTAEWAGPGAYDVPEQDYHADRLVPGGSLSYSGAKKLLPPSCPALYRHGRDSPQQHKAVFDFGTAVHTLVLQSGAALYVIDEPDWRKKAAQDERDGAYEHGFAPLLVADYLTAAAAAAAVHAHPIAGPLFARPGAAEQSLYWTTIIELGGAQVTVGRRARPDWQTTLADGRPVVVDLKTCVSAHPGAIAKAVWNFRYDMQADGYTDAVQTVQGLDVPPPFVFVFVEKAAPHLVTVCELDGHALTVGRASNLRALRIYAECQASGVWPSYVSDIPLITLPPWAREDNP